MRFELKTANQHSPWSDILALWRAADEIELFDGGWLFDHFYPIVPAADPMGPCLEAWTMLAALAQATSRLRLGTMVTGVHHRHPAVLAKMVATVDVISGGRLELGLGAGWNDEESGAYGMELGNLSERFDRFDEALHVITSLLSRDTTDFDGTYYQLSDAHCEPKCVQTPYPPILIGGIGEKRTLPAVAQYAQRWDSAAASTPAEFARKREVLARYCHDIGRDVRDITTSTHIRWRRNQDVNEVVESAAEFATEDLDVAIIYLDPPLDPARLESLAEALGPLR
ncbi:MAG TPA: LLM class F420-dependent oxidoreductase [Solirubrobacteraceae bacterium]|jgi:F420-dependent oxidoreductase-like protein